MALKRINGRSTELVALVGGGEPVVSTITGLSVPQHDYIELSYSGANLIGVIYKLGGTWNSGAGTYTGGSIVGQLELVYAGDTLTRIVKVL